MPPTPPTPATTPDGIADLRRMSAAELERLGRDSLRDHVLAQAAVARHKHGPLDAGRLDALLQDPECLRHPTRLVFEFGPMALHQLGEPDVDWRDPEGRGRVIHLRPALRDNPDGRVLATVYLIPVVNYGSTVTDALCLAYGAILLGLEEEEYYRRLCLLADSLGVESRSEAAGEG
ncbi:MAG TPA: hypothetical protein PKW90_27990 [Myxococcota bacterium]|nr:hypothetical protein [Myxococcota bacterium]